MPPIKPDYLTLHKLLSERLFKIPDYQRAYSWTGRQRKDLFEDIIKVYEKSNDRIHFMATIVCHDRGKILLGTNQFDQLDVVDGQQRITTLIILLKSIEIALNSKQGKNKEEERAAIEIKELLVKVDRDRLLLLQTNHDTSHYFGNFMRSGDIQNPKHADTIADREILSAIQDCQEFVNDKWEYELLELLTLVKNNLSFILYLVNEEQEVYTIFEVLNSRGIEVSWLDRLKSILMGKSFEISKKQYDGESNNELIEDLRRTWSDIYKEIGLRQGLNSEALRFAATLWKFNSRNRVLDERNSVEVFRSAADTESNIREVSRWILEVTKACDVIASYHHLGAVTRISQVRLLAVAIYLAKHIKKNEKEKLLDYCEKVSFRIYAMLGNDARSQVGNYLRLARKIVYENISIEDAILEIKKIGKEFPIDDAIKKMEEKNCYDGWKNELRHFIFRREKFLAKQQRRSLRQNQWKIIWENNLSDSIEHILPQSKADEDIKHNIGNLTLLPPKTNSQLKDKDPENKSDVYIRTGILTTIEIGETIKTSGWSKDVILERCKELCEWARNEWSD